MRVLLTGANGFIGSHVLASLLSGGHQVVAAVRDPAKIKAQFPDIDAIAIDMNRDTSPDVWMPRLKGIDAIINCAGVLHSRHGQQANAIHAKAPIALFDAAVRSGIGKIIQLSAIGTEAPTEFAITKRMADEHLAKLPVDWTILRPSIVYGRQSYGGTAMLRALAAFPFFTPLIGKGDQKSTPIHISDLCRTMELALTSAKLTREIIYPCGPETMTMRDMVQAYRGWLGLHKVAVLPVPAALLAPAAKLGDAIGTGPLTSTSLIQLEHGTDCDPKAFSAATGLKPRSLPETLRNEPAGTADLWHARLYLLRPAIRVTLILLWTLSAIAGFLAPLAISQQALAPIGLSPEAVQFVSYGASTVDALIALALLVNFKPRLLASIQLAVVFAYTIALSLLQPSLWLEPYGSLLKNIPILALILVSRIVEEER